MTCIVNNNKPHTCMLRVCSHEVLSRLLQLTMLVIAPRPTSLSYTFICSIFSTYIEYAYTI